MNLRKVKSWLVDPLTVDPAELEKKKPDLTLVRKSILKNGYRAFFLNERDEVTSSPWYLDFLKGTPPSLFVDGSGLYSIVNIDVSESELYLSRLNADGTVAPHVFYSWQADYNASRNVVGAALAEAMKDVNATRSRKLTVVKPQKDDEGSRDIVESIKKNLRRAVVAIFDITNVAAVPSSGGKTVKTFPNANVVYELSLAIAQKPPDQVILVKLARADIGSDAVPFDFEHNRRIDVKGTAKKDKESLQKALGNIIEAAAKRYLP